MESSIRPIRTEEDHKVALSRIKVLMDADIEKDALKKNELDILGDLVAHYEAQLFPIDLPNSIDAIRFRMEQEGLSSRDLIPIIGSRSKVSEVLSGKRNLSLKMIRALHEHLKIPAEVLLKEPGGAIPQPNQFIDWSKFPLVEMANREWIPKKKNLKDHAEELIRHLIERTGLSPDALPEILCRENSGSRQNAKVDVYALQAWCYELIARAKESPLTVSYSDNVITPEFTQNLVRLSWSDNGPRLAKDYLESRGIHLIWLPHLPRTHLDGVALRLSDGIAVIGLTLRYDRLDNFWFCLFHELAHLALHLKSGTNEVFVDDLSLRRVSASVDNKHGTVDKELQADEWAQNALIPEETWDRSKIWEKPTPSAVTTLAHQLEIHPAIIAGRIRRKRGNYRLLTHYVGAGLVRSQFC